MLRALLTTASVVDAAKSSCDKIRRAQKILSIRFIKPTAKHIINLAFSIATISRMDVAILASAFAVISRWSRATSDCQLRFAFFICWTWNVLASCAALPAAICHFADWNCATCGTAMNSEWNACVRRLTSPALRTRTARRCKLDRFCRYDQQSRRIQSRLKDSFLYCSNNPLYLIHNLIHLTPLLPAK